MRVLCRQGCPQLKGGHAAIRKRYLEGQTLTTKPLVERRKYPRLRTEVVVAIERDEPPHVVAYAVDLSIGGIRFQYLGTGSEFEVDELVRMHIRLDDCELSVTGEILRILDLDGSAHELALAFVEIDEGAQDLLIDYVGELEDQPSSDA